MTSSHIVLHPDAQDLLFRRAHTANAFTDEAVSDERIRALHDLIKWAPTAYNQQPLRVVLVRTPEARARLVPLMDPGNQEKTGKAPLVAILAADTRFTEYLPAQLPAWPEAADAVYGDPAARERSALMNAALQIGYFILGVRAIGLAAGPMDGFDAEKVDAEFFPGGRYRSLVIVNMGKPAPNAFRPRGPRMPYETVFTTV